MYEAGGNGLVPKDPTSARKLYAASAGHGMKEAQARLDAMGPAPPRRNGQRHRRAVRPMQPAPPAEPPPGSAMQPVPPASAPAQP